MPGFEPGASCSQIRADGGLGAPGGASNSYQAGQMTVQTPPDFYGVFAGWLPRMAPTPHQDRCLFECSNWLPNRYRARRPQQAGTDLFVPTYRRCWGHSPSLQLDQALAVVHASGGAGLLYFRAVQRLPGKVLEARSRRAICVLPRPLVVSIEVTTDKNGRCDTC
jgi:hypothetical protein